MWKFQNFSATQILRESATSYVLFLAGQPQSAATDEATATAFDWAKVQEEVKEVVDEYNDTQVRSSVFCQGKKTDCY